MKVLGILLLVIGLGMVIWSVVAWGHKPETQQAVRETKEQVTQKVEEIKEEAGTAKEQVEEKVGETIESKTSPWPMWAGVIVLLLGILFLALALRRKKRDKEGSRIVTTTETVTTRKRA